MLQVVKCVYSVYWIDDASSNQSGHMLLFPFIVDLGIPTIFIIIIQFMHVYKSKDGHALWLKCIVLYA